MELLTQQYGEFVKILISLLFYTVTAMGGAFLKDMYETNFGNEPKINFKRIFISMIVTGFLSIIIEQYIHNTNVVVGLNFFIAVVGFDIFVRFSSWENIKKSFLDLREIANAIQAIKYAITSNAPPQYQNTGMGYQGNTFNANQNINRPMTGTPIAQQTTPIQTQQPVNPSLNQTNSGVAQQQVNIPVQPQVIQQPQPQQGTYPSGKDPNLNP